MPEGPLRLNLSGVSIDPCAAAPFKFSEEGGIEMVRVACWVGRIFREFAGNGAGIALYTNRESASTKTPS